MVKTNTQSSLEADGKILSLEARLLEKETEVMSLKRSLSGGTEKIDRAMKLVANLEAQIQAQNTLLNSSKQTDVLRVAASKMHDQDIQALAREVGFSEIRVKE